MKNLKKNIPLFLVALALLVLIFMLFTQPQENPQVPESDNPDQQVFSPTLEVAPQGPSDSIVVSSATFDKPGFIAVFKTMDKSVPDESNFKGVSSAFEGKQKNIQVPLTEPTQIGDTYTVIIHVDDGDKIFEFPGDDEPSSFGDGTVNFVRTNIVAPSVPTEPAN